MAEGFQSFLQALFITAGLSNPVADPPRVVTVPEETRTTIVQAVDRTTTIPVDEEG